MNSYFDIQGNIEERELRFVLGDVLSARNHNYGRGVEQHKELRKYLAKVKPGDIYAVILVEAVKS